MLRVEALAVARGGLRLLEGVSLSLSAGQALMLRGPNGIGKTTLLRCVAGLQRADSGTITVDPDHIAYAGHSDGVKATLSVRENLSFWAAVFGTYRVEDAFQAFNLTALEDRAARDLSAGQRRRLGLARLLLTDRPLWLLDEPTVSLDSATTAIFSRVLADHLKGGGAGLISSHLDIGEVKDSLDLTPFRAKPPVHDSEEAFL